MLVQDPIKDTHYGRVEERAPLFGFRFPDNFRDAERRRILRENTNRLTATFDIYQTLKSIVRMNVDTAGLQAQWLEEPGKNMKVNNIGNSLMDRALPRTRSCTGAKVPSEFCLCQVPAPHLDDVDWPVVSVCDPEFRSM